MKSTAYNKHVSLSCTPCLVYKTLPIAIPTIATKDWRVGQGVPKYRVSDRLMKKGVRDLHMRKTLNGELAIRSKLEASREKKPIVKGTKPRTVSCEIRDKFTHRTIPPTYMTDTVLVSWTARTNAGKGNISSVNLFTTLRVLLSKL